MVTGPMPRKPNATRPKAKMGAAKRNFCGMSASSAGFCEKKYDVAMSTMMHNPIQNADMLPATKPDKMFSDAPPCLEQFVTSRTCRSEEHTSELQSRRDLVCRLLLAKKK